MASNLTYRRIRDTRLGRNGYDPPLSIPNGQLLEALNVDFYEGSLARKRPGATAFSTASSNFAANMASLFRYVPGQDETAAEFWGIDASATPRINRVAAGSTWATVSPTDNIATRPQDVATAVLNGKLFFAYDSTQDRLHVWDGTDLRRVGLATPAAPTAANQGGGTYAATIRYYKVAYTVQSTPGVTARRSELSAALTFTPNGASLSARVTKPAAISEGETHWELYGSPDGTNFFLVATQAVGTTTFDDTFGPAGYYGGGAAPVIGTNVVPTSWKHIISDGNRLLGGGAWETGGRTSRVWFTPVLGSSDVGDDERIPNTVSQKNWIDVGENDGSFITGFGGPVNGSVICFKYRAIYELQPTGDVSTPYRVYGVGKGSGIGCVGAKTVAMGEDAVGRQAVYFLSHRGPYRIGVNGLEYLGRDVEDIWASVNLGATTTVGHGVYHSALHQVWWWIATGSNNEPDTKIVYDVERGVMQVGDEVRGGWAKHTGNSASARCSVMMSNTIGATMSRDLKPYIGQSGDFARVWKCDAAGTTDDAGTAYQAYLDLPPLDLGGLPFKHTVYPPYLLAKVATGVTIRLTLTGDFGLQAARTSDVLLTAAGSETRVFKQFEAGEEADIVITQARIGDSAAVSNAWVLDELIVPFKKQEAA